MTTTVRWSQPLFAPALVRLAVNDGLWPTTPSDLAAAPAVAAELARRAGRYDRAALAQVLLSYNVSLGQDDAALANARRLAQPDALVVVTGQQAGLFTGPLYTLYKALSAVRYAAACEARLGVPVIPLFWHATEDHDLSEIAACHLPDRTLRAAFPAGGHAAEALTTEPAVTAVVREFLAQLGDAPCREATAALLEAPFLHYGLYASALLARLCRGTGLVLLEPRLLRPLAVPFFTRVLAERQAVRQALAEGADRLTRRGQPVPFPPDDGCGLFLLDDAGRRHRLAERGAHLVAGGQQYAPEALVATIAAAPELVSTGAYLRPVLQDLLLPTLAYVAGPGEFAYHLQLGPLHAHFDALPPLLLPRHSFTLTTARERKLIQRLGLQTADLFGDPARHYFAEPLPPATAATFTTAEADLAALLARLRAGLDATILPARLTGFEHRLREQLARLRHKAHGDYLRQAGIDNARLDRCFAVLRPRGQPQERHLNVLHFYPQLGPALPATLLAAADPAIADHQILHLEC
jgi:bacillithiol biosynthesis cysteine-adding enzyme BshC